jgi:hypothetical protein
MTPDGTIQADTPDGGRVIIVLADAGARAGGPAIEAALALVRTDGPQGEIEGVIVAEASRHGLDAAVSGSRHPTTIVVQSRRGPVQDS